MAKRKNNAPNLPAQSLARARAELQGITGTFADPNAPVNGAEIALRPKIAQPIAYRSVTVEDLKNEYVYVISDIRNMALLAGLLFVGMVVVSIVFI